MLNIDYIFWNIFNFTNIFIYFILFGLLISNTKSKIYPKTKYLVLGLISLISFACNSNVVLISTCTSIIFHKLNYDEDILKCIYSSVIYWFIIYQSIEFISSNIIYIINYSSIFKIEVIDSTIVIIESLILKIVLMII
ncbi:MAG: hypothetical protein ACRCXT_17005, partial [Paraclostridium sp.]